MAGSAAIARRTYGVNAYRTVSGGTLELPWWTDWADLVLLPAELAGLPLLAWAVLAGRRPRLTVVTR